MNVVISAAAIPPQQSEESEARGLVRGAADFVPSAPVVLICLRSTPGVDDRPRHFSAFASQYSAELIATDPAAATALASAGLSFAPAEF